MYESIKADLLFKGEYFTIQGSTAVYQCTGEPWITGTPGNDKVHIPVYYPKMRRNHILTVPLGTLAATSKEPVR